MLVDLDGITVVRSTQMKLSNHLIIAGGVFCCLLSNIGTVTAFLLINPSSVGKTITIITCDSYDSSTVLFSTPTENNRRRQFLVSSIIAAPILIGRGAAWADEPMNIYYKSKADEEDPLAVFGRSLSQKTTITDDEGSNNKGVDGSRKESKQPSFSPPPQADLTKALQEKSQQRRIDPRTHG